MTWLEDSFYKYAVGILLVLLNILLIYYTAPFFSPLIWFVTAILLPVLFSTFLYYILRPLVKFLERGMPSYLAILVTFLIALLIVGTAVYFLIPAMIEAAGHLTPEKFEPIKKHISDFIERIQTEHTIAFLPPIQNIIIEYAPKINALIYSASVNLIYTIANLAIGLMLTPFVLFYFFKDDSLLAPFVLRYLPNQFQDEVQKIMHEVDATLAEFIQSQMIIASVIGGCVLLGYLVIGLPNAFALAIFAMIFYIIPFLGTFIALIPALIVASTIDVYMMLKVVAVVMIAHLLEANLLTPRVMSQRLNIHPLTIIFLLLAAGTLYGLMGLLLVTPTYAIIKVIVWNLYKISRLRYVTAKIAAREEKENELS